uniref:Si:ch73-233k15.2 n=1 Tax=Sinocyclocheilus grahami TaxID=75366 RepID=A0A672KJ89_SINGR
MTAYVEDTLDYIETVRDFCDQEQRWTSERKAELEKMRDISENQQEEKLHAVLADTLEGLEKLEPFLDAVEKLTVTSSHVFSGQIFLLRGKSPERVQSVIADARIDAPVLVHFKRNAETFFRPLLHNVNVLVFQLDSYVLKTEQICMRMKQKFKMGRPSVQLVPNLSEDTMNQMLDRLSQFHWIVNYMINSVFFLLVQDEPAHPAGLPLSGKFPVRSAVKLDTMKKDTSICTVVGSSVGIVGGASSIIGLALAPFTAGTSLLFSLAGFCVGFISTGITVGAGIAEMVLNHRHEHKAQSYLKSYKDDMIKIEDCLKEQANSERPLVQPSAVDVTDILDGCGDVVQEVVNVVDGVADVAVHKSEKAAKAVTEIELTDFSVACEVPQVATNLSKTGAKLAKAETLIVKCAPKVVSGFTHLFFIGLDIFFIVKESISLAKGSVSEFSKLVHSRAALWKSELEAWEKIHDSLCIGIETISKSQDALENITFFLNIKTHVCVCL